MKTLIIYFLFLVTTFGMQGQSRKYTIYEKGGKAYETNRYKAKEEFLKFNNDDISYKLPYTQLDSIVFFEKNKKTKLLDPVTYKFIPISEEKGALMKVIERGRCTLFLRRYTLNGGISINYYAYREGESRPKFLSTRDLISGLNFIKNTSEYFSDCEALVKKIKNKDFKKKETLEMVKYYNAKCN